MGVFFLSKIPNNETMVLRLEEGLSAAARERNAMQQVGLDSPDSPAVLAMEAMAHL